MKKTIIFSLVACIFLSMLTVMPVFGATETEIGDYIQIGEYYGAPILWRCVDRDENGLLILSDKILCIKAFDSNGTNTSGSHFRGYTEYSMKGYYRQCYGSNCWEDSNIRSWLNSTASEGNVEWLCGNPPYDEDFNNFYHQGFNEYDNEAGFLTHFTKNELLVMKSVIQKSILDGYEYSDSSNKVDPDAHKYNDEISDVITNYYGALSTDVKDRVFLLDVKQINSVYNNTGILGKNYYIGKPTDECVKNSEYESNLLKSNLKWNTWLRTPYTNNLSCYVRNVGTDGKIYYSYAYSSEIGVRPAFYLNENALLGMTGSGTEEDPYILIPDPNYVSVELNSEPLGFDVAPVMESDRVLVPMRAIFEALGATVNWTDYTQTATATKDNDVITLQIDNNIMTKNGEQITLDVPARLVNDRTLVPIRAVAEGLNAQVDWIDETNTVVITKE